MSYLYLYRNNKVVAAAVVASRSFNNYIGVFLSTVVVTAAVTTTTALVQVDDDDDNDNVHSYKEVDVGSKITNRMVNYSSMYNNTTTTTNDTTTKTTTTSALYRNLQYYFKKLRSIHDHDDKCNHRNHAITYCDATTTSATAATALSRTTTTVPKLVEKPEEECNTTTTTTKTTTPKTPTTPSTTRIRPGGQMLSSSSSYQDNNDDEHNNDEEEYYYYNLFPLRQLFVPAMEYPLWDENWDERSISSSSLFLPTSRNHDTDIAEEEEEEEERQKRHYIRQLRKNGVTRHIILIRHGQYDETHKEDETRILTPLGRDQAHLTGKRIAEMIQGAQETFGSPCHVKVLRVSNLTRAKETATIIASYLPKTVDIMDPDPLLNEGRPCHTIPGGKMSKKDIETTDQHHTRIENAFRKYIYRAAPPPSLLESSSSSSPPPTDTNTTVTTSTSSSSSSSPTLPLPESKHEFEIIVCHANVIRYIMCRALQLPPEVWLRFCPFNCSLTYLTIRPTGTVSCRMIGDIGHLPYSASTFSGHYGYNW